MDKHNLTKRLLIIDDEANMRHMLSTVLKKAGYVVDTAAEGLEALQMIDQTPYDFILCDIKMPKMDGMQFLKSGRDRIGTTTVIMMSAYGTIDTAIEAMKLGAYDYISKPFKADEVYLALKKAEERETLRRENRRLRERIQKIERNCHFGNIIAQSKTMRSVLQLAERAARYKTTVLILGDSGTGKELIAKGIHFSGERSKMPLIPLNCGGIPENLLESELFGYKKGAFTGADRDKKGLFCEAEGGTLFLDEIGDLPSPLQVKLLRVLQENEVWPVGDSKPMKIDVRVIAATAKNLEEEVRKGRFREDLYYRLNVLTIKMPPLRTRAEDIPLLCKHFITRFNEIFGKDLEGVASEAMAWLLQYQWPGNVRELENVIERAMVMTDGSEIMAEHLPPELIRSAADPSGDSLYEGLSLKNAQRVLEKSLIRQALRETGGNRSQAARLLEISHPSLLSKIKTYDLS
jgi:two-component system, NtrC family, response regulator AtoC